MKEGDFPEGGLHIGKNSWGWTFQFQAYPEKKLIDTQSWRDFTKYGYIYDEYDDEISYDEFWEMVEETKKPMPDGREKHVLTDPEHDPSPLDLEIPMWRDEGYGFTAWDFS